MTAKLLAALVCAAISCAIGMTPARAGSLDNCGTWGAGRYDTSPHCMDQLGFCEEPTLRGLASVWSSHFFHRAAFGRSSVIQPLTCADASTVSMRARTRLAVSGIALQIGSSTPSTALASI